MRGPGVWEVRVVAPDDLDHAIRTLRCLICGFALLQAASGFQRSSDPGESFAWTVRFAGTGLRGMGSSRDDGDPGRVVAAHRTGREPSGKRASSGG